MPPGGSTSEIQSPPPEAPPHHAGIDLSTHEFRGQTLSPQQRVTTHVTAGVPGNVYPA